MEEDINKIFKKLKGQIIQKFSVKENSDQRFYLITDKASLKFGANDLGVWIEEYKEIGNQKKNSIKSQFLK